MFNEYNCFASNRPDDLACFSFHGRQLAKGWAFRRGELKFVSLCRGELPIKPADILHNYFTFSTILRRIYVFQRKTVPRFSTRKQFVSSINVFFFDFSKSNNVGLLLPRTRYHTNKAVWSEQARCPRPLPTQRLGVSGSLSNAIIKRCQTKTFGYSHLVGFTTVNLMNGILCNIVRK